MQLFQSHTWRELPCHSNIIVFSATNWVNFVYGDSERDFITNFCREDKCLCKVDGVVPQHFDSDAINHSILGISLLSLVERQSFCRKTPLPVLTFSSEFRWNDIVNYGSLKNWKILIILRFNLSEFSFGNHSWKPLRSLSYIFANPFTKSKITTLVMRHGGQIVNENFSSCLFPG